MDSTLNPANVAALAGILILGASVPSVSVLVVSARSAALGFTHGVLTSVGIVTGDVVFILIAIYGLSVLADLMGDYFRLIKYLGGAYLVWLGVVLWRSAPRPGIRASIGRQSMWSSFFTGLLITLADQKAILFYLGILPAFLDLSAFRFGDTALVLFVAVLAVAGPKLFYAFVAERAGRIFLDTNAAKIINAVAGSVMAGVGILIAVTA